jgi:hypothetical protein
MPRQANAQPFGKYHAELGRLFRQMLVDPRIPQEITSHVEQALSGVQKLLVRQTEPVAEAPDRKRSSGPQKSGPHKSGHRSRRGTP